MVLSHRGYNPILEIEGNSSIATDMNVLDGVVRAYGHLSKRREGDKTPDMGTGD